MQKMNRKKINKCFLKFGVNLRPNPLVILIIIQRFKILLQNNLMKKSLSKNQFLIIFNRQKAWKISRNH